MISGYNTDVPHEDVVYHVQTEDKGTSTAWIESLVYVGGAILARRRSSYKKVLERGGGDDAIVRLMDWQHRSLIAEIRGGKFDESSTGNGETGEETQEPEADASTAEPEGEAAPELETSGEPAEDGNYSDLSLDQAILQFLNSREEQDELVLTVDATTELSLGKNVDLSFIGASRLTGRPVPGAKVEVRMISTVAEPLHLAKGETDAHGTLSLSFRIPRLQRGSGALIITARSELGEAEMKHLL